MLRRVNRTYDTVFTKIEAQMPTNEDDSISNGGANATESGGQNARQTSTRTATAPAKKKGVFEWLMLAVGLSYGDEGEDKWVKQREIAARERAAREGSSETRS